jgi:PPK2 family polyphosphate:nucleotide phosphotransferase
MEIQALELKGNVSLKDLAADDTGGLGKKEAKTLTRKACAEIGDFQELLYANANRAVLLIFQGLDASGKDGAIRSVLRNVNPAGVETAYFKVPSADERAHDFLWRVHRAVPRFGRIGVFNRSHYEAVLAERVLGMVTPKTCEQRYQQIIAFERMLVENGVVLLKFFLHISRKEQRERLIERLENPKKNWKFSEADLRTRKQWHAYGEAYDDALNATNHSNARWHLVPADHNWYRDYLVASATRDALKSLRLKWPKPKEDLSKIKIK